jgi:hypothetical protein
VFLVIFGRYTKKQFELVSWWKQEINCLNCIVVGAVSKARPNRFQQR